jgi:hypothetical protein
MSEFDMPPEEVVKHLPVGERLQRVGLPTGLTTRQANAITQARLQLALSELADANVENVQKWLEQVGDRSPAEALRLYMELLEFRMPRMKAATVVANLTPDSGNAKDLKHLSIEELQSIVAEG